MAILSFRFILVAFLAYFLRIEAKWALLSLFLKVLGGGSKEVDSEKVDSKVAYSKDAGSRKAVSKKVYGFSADFTLYIF
jgi:hypothetical protein